MSDDSPTEVKSSPSATEEADRAPAEAQEKPRPTGRFKRTLKDVADWVFDSDPVDWIFERILEGVLFVLGVGALVLLSLFAPDGVDSVINWILNKDSDLAVLDLVGIGLVVVVAVGAILAFLWRAARWLAGKIRAQRAAQARRAADRQGDISPRCRADHRVGDDQVGGDLVVTDRSSAERWAGWVVFAVLLGAALLLLRRRGDR